MIIKLYFSSHKFFVINSLISSVLKFHTYLFVSNIYNVLPCYVFIPVLWIRNRFNVDPDPDPALFSQSGYGSGSRSRVLMTKNSGEVFIPQKINLALQNLNFLHFCGSCWPSLDPDPYSHVRIRIQPTNECGSMWIRIYNTGYTTPTYPRAQIRPIPCSRFLR
jgi:hypothetical protein